MFPSRLVSALGKGALENNYSLDFDGSDDYVVIADDASLDDVGDLSIAAWFKTSTTANEILIDKGYTDSYRIYGGRNDGNSPLILVAGGNIRAASDYSDGLWHFMTVVYSDAGDYLKLYMDAVLDNENTSYTQSLSANSNNLQIGKAVSGSAYQYEGLTDEVAIWNKALSAGDIAALYEARGTSDLNDDGSSGNLVGWWRFEEGSGTSAIDSSANSNTGTLTNGPAYSRDTP